MQSQTEWTREDVRRMQKRLTWVRMAPAMLTEAVWVILATQQHDMDEKKVLLLLVGLLGSLFLVHIVWTVFVLDSWHWYLDTEDKIWKWRQTHSH